MAIVHKPARVKHCDTLTFLILSSLNSEYMCSECQERTESECCFNRNDGTDWNNGAELCNPVCTCVIKRNINY